MEEMKKTTDVEQEMQFNIGKSYGLSKQEQKIEDYKKKLEDINGELISSANAGLEDIKERVKLLKAEIASMHTNILDVQKDTLEKLEKLMEKIRQQDSKGQFVNQKLKDMSEEILNLTVENFKRSMQGSFKTEAEIVKMIAGLTTKADSLLEQVQQKNLDFVDTLKKKEVDFSELEKGYLYGDALRIALSKR